MATDCALKCIDARELKCGSMCTANAVSLSSTPELSLITPITRDQHNIAYMRPNKVSVWSSDACYDRGAPHFFLSGVPHIESLRPFPKTHLEKTKSCYYTGWTTPWPRYRTRITKTKITCFRRFWIKEPRHSEKPFQTENGIPLSYHASWGIVFGPISRTWSIANALPPSGIHGGLL